MTIEYGTSSVEVVDLLSRILEPVIIMSKPGKGFSKTSRGKGVGENYVHLGNNVRRKVGWYGDWRSY